MQTIEALIRATRAEAERAPFPIDEPIYERARKDPLEPVLFGGSTGGRLCVFGRDLGRDEVAASEPMIGAGGRLVREGIYRALRGEEPPANDRRLAPALEVVMLSNTVPYKPPGNKAYAESVKKRFRPFLAELLAAHWAGDRVITLGNEAFQWFAPYVEAGQSEVFWKREDRYEAEIEAEVAAVVDGEPIVKRVTLMPLPHPSPLNARWYGLFPSLLQKRLRSIDLRA